MSVTADRVAQLLRDAHEGKAGALETLMEIFYDDLHRMAQHHMRERFGVGLPGISLEPKALVNETFLRLVKQRTHYANRRHFFAIATRVMLRVLLDYDRKRAAAKRGVGTVRVSLVGLAANSEKRNVIGIPDFVEALERLEKHDARTAEVAELRLIWGLTVPEIAAELGLSESTIERDWRFGRRWLASALGSSHPRR